MTSRTPQSLTSVIWVLGLGQVIGYGTIFYSFSLIAPGPSAEFGIGLPALFAILSAATLLSGLVGPRIGRTIDAIGGPTVMAAGSLLAGIAFVLLALSPNVWVFGALIVLLQVASVAVLYNASAPTLTQFGGPDVRRAIVLMTLMMGMSSTIFWPIIGWLMPHLGWRWTYAVLGLLNLVVAAPCHFWLRGRLIRRRAATRTSPADIEASDAPTVAAPDRRFAFWMVTACMTLSSFVSLSLAVHLVPVLTATGLGATAYVVAMAMGPAQVAIRLGQTLFFRATHPLSMATIMVISLPVALLSLLSGGPALLSGIVFTLLFGVAQGLNAIVVTTLPLVLFGRKGYGELLGRISMYRAVFTAPGAFVLSLLWNSFGLAPALLVYAAVGFSSLVPLFLLRQRLRTPTPV